MTDVKNNLEINSGINLEINSGINLEYNKLLKIDEIEYNRSIVRFRQESMSDILHKEGREFLFDEEIEEIYRM